MSSPHKERGAPDIAGSHSVGHEYCGQSRLAEPPGSMSETYICPHTIYAWRSVQVPVAGDLARHRPVEAEVGATQVASVGAWIPQIRAGLGRRVERELGQLYREFEDVQGLDRLLQ